jgi:hypothetical protein
LQAGGLAGELMRVTHFLVNCLTGFGLLPLLLDPFWFVSPVSIELTSQSIEDYTKNTSVYICNAIKCLNNGIKMRDQPNFTGFPSTENHAIVAGAQLNARIFAAPVNNPVKTLIRLLNLAVRI